ncbi:MAG TPA: AarF/ABC1/UbiB kinase family protein, partial [Candidatus Brocadiia bacterium]|nr:AarF/ABC1/UbiB kinase family protein [Candidatus Brocadiia bacterium]
LSTRPDLIPEAYVMELRALQDRVAPFDGALARRIVEDEMRRPLPERFAEFDDKPLASGSIAQVHKARLVTGEKVVVKVRRPDIREVVEHDLDILDWLAGNLMRFEAVSVFRPKMIVEEFRRTIRREMDFLSEAAYTERFRALYDGEPGIKTPKVFWEMTTSRVLTLEMMEGASISDTRRLEALKLDKGLLAKRLASFFMRQFFLAGYFHADPHPGNILVTDDGRISLVDFGLVGHLDDELRDHLATSLIAMAYRDARMLIETYLEVGFVSSETDIEGLRRELLGLLDRYYGLPLKRIDMKEAFLEVTRIARDYQIPLPRDFVLLGKSFVTITGFARELDPDFDLVSVAKPYAYRLMREKVSPKRLARGGAIYAWQTANVLRALPGQARQFSRKLLDGRLRFRLSLDEMKYLGQEVDRATNRFALSVIVGSVVIGSAVILHARIPPYVSSLPWLGFLADRWPNTSLLGLVGFLVAGALGMLVALGIWRHGKL